MSDICIIGRKEIICGFGFLGFDTFEAQSMEDVKNIIQREYKIIFLDPIYYSENFKDKIVIPLPTGENDNAINRLDNFTIAAAGIKIKDERL